jgi:hypothetical protein
MDNGIIDFELELKCSASFDMNKMLETHIVLIPSDKLTLVIRKKLAFCAALNQAIRLSEAAREGGFLTTQEEFDKDNYQFIIGELVASKTILCKDFILKYTLSEEQVEYARVNHDKETLNLIRGAKNLYVIQNKYEEASQMRDIENKIVESLESVLPWSI